MQIMIVDSSSVFRAQLRRAFNELDGLEVSATASGGRLAIQMMAQKSIDIIFISLNLEDMNAGELIKKIRNFDQKIGIIAYTLHDTFNVDEESMILKCGANAYFVMPNLDRDKNVDFQLFVREKIIKKLNYFIERTKKHPRLNNTLQATRESEATNQIRLSKAANDQYSYSNAPILRVVESRRSYKKVDLRNFTPKIIVIASSTGGPSALEAVLLKLPRSPQIPILIVQHMPESFTKHLAKRLQDASGVSCREAINGEPIRAGLIYVAPGDYHMRVYGTGSQKMIALDKTEKVNSVRPAADVLFTSAAAAYRQNCFGMVLTGMGEDGLNGSRAIKENGGAIMIQNKESCVIWGMPAAVEQDGCYDQIGDLNECASTISRFCT